MSKFKCVLFISLFIVALGTWAFYKPIHILAPQLVSLTCFRDKICTDNLSLYAEAEELYDNALQFVDSTVAKITNPPRVIFCSTESCYHLFGLDKSTAHTTPRV